MSVYLVKSQEQILSTESQKILEKIIKRKKRNSIKDRILKYVKYHWEEMIHKKKKKKLVKIFKDKNEMLKNMEKKKANSKKKYIIWKKIQKRK